MSCPARYIRSLRLPAVRLTPVERKSLEMMAAEEDRSLADMTRRVIRAEAKRRGIWDAAQAIVQGAAAGKDERVGR